MLTRLKYMLLGYKKQPNGSICFLFFLSIFSFAVGCSKAPEHRSLEEILKSGEITVITRNNAHCYYLYRDQAMGFEYDLAKAFADHLGLRLNVKTAEKWEGMIPALANGSGDIIAASMTITPERKKQVLFSDGYKEIQQHIIVHRENSEIRTIDHLAGKVIHVRKGTTYQYRLVQLKKEGIDLKMVLHDDISTQDLINQVENKSIEVTIADTNIALLNRRYYPRILVSEPISEKAYLGWAVHPKAKDLLNQINEFFRTIKGNGQFEKIYDRYYSNVESFDYLDLRTFHKRIKTRLPRFSSLIQAAAEDYHFDWRLIAAQIYQESHFNPSAKSPKGAYGLMQLTLSMAKSLGVENIFDPKSNIDAGTKLLRDLYDHFDKALPSDRIYLALAAYNIGLGHIWDARELARKKNLNPNKWSSLRETLPLLRQHKYYKNLKYGYARGTEPIRYIQKIMIYYDILKRQSVEYETKVDSAGDRA